MRGRSELKTMRSDARNQLSSKFQTLSLPFFKYSQFYDLLSFFFNPLHKILRLHFVVKLTQSVGRARLFFFFTPYNLPRFPPPLTKEDIEETGFS